MAVLKLKAWQAVGTGLAFPARHPVSFVLLVGLWAGLRLAGTNFVALPLLVACVGFPLVFHRVLTPRAPLSPGLALGVLTSIGALLFAALVFGLAMITVVEVGGVGRGSDEEPRALLLILLLLASMILPLALQLTAPALSFYDRRLRGLKAWRVSLKHFGVFLATAVMLNVSLIVLLIATLVIDSLASGLAQSIPIAKFLVETGLPGLFTSYAFAVTAGAMADLTRQTVGNGADGVAGVFD